MEKNQMNGWFNSPEPTIFWNTDCPNLSIGRHSCSAGSLCAPEQMKKAFCDLQSTCWMWWGADFVFHPFRVCCSQNGYKWRWRNGLWLISLGGLNISLLTPACFLLHLPTASLIAALWQGGCLWSSSLSPTGNGVFHGRGWCSASGIPVS